MNHPHLANFFGAYLNQDYSLHAETLEGVIDAFRQDATDDQLRALREDIASFRRWHAHDLEQAFAGSFGADFEPALWGLSADAFLDLLDLRLAS